MLRKKMPWLAKLVLHKQRRAVSTWTPLASAFNTSPQKRMDFWAKNVGLFQVPELKNPEGFRQARDHAMSRGWQLLEAAVKSKPGIETVTLFDELSDTLCRVADLSDFVRCAHPNQEFAEAAANAYLELGTMVEELNTNRDLYLSIERVTENKEIMNSLDDETRTVADLFMFDFKISGIHLDAEQRHRAVQLHEELLQLTSLFLQQAQLPAAFPKTDLPEEFHGRFEEADGNLIISGLHSENPDPVTREASFRLFYYTNPTTEATLHRLLRVRQEIAQLVGFETFAHRALQSTMAKCPDSVLRFLHSLTSSLRPVVKSEFDELQALKAAHSSVGGDFEAWDLHYHVTKMKETKASIDPAVYSSYFSLGDCMEGLNLLFQSLFDVTVRSHPPAKGETWSSDVIKLAVEHSTEGVLGHIYCDFFHREGKPQQDCHFTIRGGRRLQDGSYQSPIVVLMLHLPSPSSSQPPLLSPSMVSNLFHEMGHAMHSMLARTRYQHVTGTRCATDFAEVPSVLMEYFATDPRVLSTFAKHHKTRHVMPDDMIAKLCKADKICAATEMQTQVLYSIVDQHLHSGTHDNAPTSDIVAKVQKDHYFMPPVPNTSWHLRFPHFASYGAKYYSYLMSRAVASRLWKNCFHNDPFNREMGNRYRREMLSHGGGKDPVLMYKDMLQEEFNLEVLASTLINDLQT